MLKKNSGSSEGTQPEYKDPKLAAVEAELAKDRGEIYDPLSEKGPNVHQLGDKADVGSLINEAKLADEKRAKKKNSALHRAFTFGAILQILTFGLYKPAKELKKDYTIEYDPKTGGYHRVYIVNDRKKR